MRSIAGLSVCVVLGITGAMAQQTPRATGTPSKAWIAVSDGYTQQLLAVQLKHHPEGGSAEGLAQFDEQVSTPTLADFKAERTETEAVLAKLKAAAATEKDDIAGGSCHSQQGDRAADSHSGLRRAA